MTNQTKYWSIALVVIIAVALIGGGVYFWQTQSSTEVSRASGVTTTEPESGSLLYEKQVVREESVDAFGSRITLNHLCEGTVLLSGEPSNRSYCIGNNELIMVNTQGEEQSLVTMVSSSIDDAPVLEEVETIGYGDSIKLLFAFDVIGCSLTQESCGAGMPSHYVNYLYDPSQKSSLISLSNYPEHGRLVWNGTATKALVPVKQVGGAGCDYSVLNGYDLLADKKTVLTKESGCEFQKGEATDVTGDTVRAEWGPAYWSGNKEYTTVILNTDGTWKEIIGTF